MEIYLRKLVYKIGKTTEKEQLTLDFEDGLSRTVEERINLGLVLFRIPNIDDVSHRIFDTMDEYRKWSETTLPRYLGYYQKND